MVVKMALYGLKLSGAAFRAKLASLLHNIEYTPFKTKPDVWMRPSIISDGTEYHKYDLVCVDDILVIICVHMKKIEGIKCVFKLNGYKAESLNMYLGASLEQFETKEGSKCWSMSAKKYVKAAVVNLEAALKETCGYLPVILQFRQTTNPVKMLVTS